MSVHYTVRVIDNLYSIPKLHMTEVWVSELLTESHQNNTDLLVQYLMGVNVKLLTVITERAVINTC